MKWVNAMSTFLIFVQFSCTAWISNITAWSLPANEQHLLHKRCGWLRWHKRQHSWRKVARGTRWSDGVDASIPEGRLLGISGKWQTTWDPRWKELMQLVLPTGGCWYIHMGPELLAQGVPPKKCSIMAIRSDNPPGRGDPGAKDENIMRNMKVMATRRRWICQK